MNPYENLLMKLLGIASKAERSSNTLTEIPIHSFLFLSSRLLLILTVHYILSFLLFFFLSVPKFNAIRFQRHLTLLLNHVT